MCAGSDVFGRYRLIGEGIYFFPVLPSTQDRLAQLHREGSPHGTLVIAGRQVSGRGRRGDHWLSPRGGLWFSLLLSPVDPARRFGLLRSAALCLRSVLEIETGLDFQFKMPNDILYRGRKVAGLILEGSGTVAFLGIGVNANCRVASSLFPAVGLLEASGKKQDRGRILGRFLDDFQTAFSRESAGMS